MLEFLIDHRQVAFEDTVRAMERPSKVSQTKMWHRPIWTRTQELDRSNGISIYADEWVVARLEEQNSFKLHDVYELVPRSEAVFAGKKIFKPRQKESVSSKC